jgi:aminoglycoside/choline kinase family phosphotransferase
LTKKVLDQLFDLQNATLHQIDYSQTSEYQSYSQLPILHDLNYFKFLLVDVLGIEYHKTTLLLEFNHLANEIEKLQPQGLMIRDFQSRNIMVNEKNEVFFIDYQSAMLGPRMYDVISFLYQAKANFSDSFKTEMLNYYYQKHSPSEIQLLQQATPFIQLIRFLQVLGAYGFRGLVQRKKHFLESLPMGIQNLSNFAQQWSKMNQYPELRKIIHELENPAILNAIKSTST